jgi:hypothetical protein
VFRRKNLEQQAEAAPLRALTRLLQGQDHNGYPAFVSDCCLFVTAFARRAG